MDAERSSTLLLIGRVGRPHGLRGECKVIPETDDPERILRLRSAYVGDTPADARAYAIRSARAQQTKLGALVLLRLEGVEDVQGAAALSQRSVYARETDLPPLASDEFFLHDVVGLAVLTDTGDAIGVVRDVWATPANNIYVVARPGKRDALIPATPAFIEKVDIKGRKLVVRPIEGLLD